MDRRKGGRKSIYQMGAIALENPLEADQESEEKSKEVNDTILSW